MTHKDIKTKFMIEYDKANVTSSYPSLTEYEVATVLDKAYNALIAQKVTGNNIRRTPFEADVKSISDLQPLVKTENVAFTKIDDVNVLKSNLPDDFLYYVAANIIWNTSDGAYVFHETGEPENASSVVNISTISTSIAQLIREQGDVSNGMKFYKNEFETLPDLDTVYTDGMGYHFYFTSTESVPYDNIVHRKMPIRLITHQMAEKFIASSYNIPWIKQPVCYIENGEMYVVYDSFKDPDADKKLDITFIKQPNRFVKPLIDDDTDIGEEYYNLSDDTAAGKIKSQTFFEYELESDWKQYDPNIKDEMDARYNFECNSTMAEELVSLAVTFALENVESQRLNSKLNTRGLEA